MDNNKNINTHILVCLPHSIGGRLTMSSILDGFIQNAIKVSTFDELLQPQHVFNELVSKNKFDFIAGYDFAGLKLKIDNALKIPCINYFSDVIDTPAAGEGYKIYRKYLNLPESFTFYWDKELLLKEKKEINNIFYMPHFVNTELYKPTQKTPKIDVMFAGRLDTSLRLNNWMKIIKSFPEKNFAWFAIEKHFKDALSRLEPSDRDILSKVYTGFIDNEYKMAEEINNAKIIFNMTSQGESSFNYRTFQAMSCEKLMLCDYRKEALTLFKNNEIVFYTDINDALKKIEFYLTNSDEYKQITQWARKTILKNHDAKKCTAEMLTTIKSYAKQK